MNPTSVLTTKLNAETATGADERLIHETASGFDIQTEEESPVFAVFEKMADFPADVACCS